MKRLVLLMVTLLATGTGAHAAEDGYAQIAEALALPAAFNAAEPVKAHSDMVVMLRMESARQQLMALKSWPTDLAPYRFRFLGPLGTAHTSMEKLRELDRFMPDFEGVVKKGLDAGPGLVKMARKKQEDLTAEDKQALGDLAVKAAFEVGKTAVNAIQASMERNAYQKAYATTRKEAVQAFAKVAPAQYKGTNKAAVKTLEIKFSGSWNNTFISDCFYLRNDTGQDLTNCTILVSLTGLNAQTDARESDSHLHYVAKWPAGKWLYASYPSKANAGIATNESTDSVESVLVTLYSDQCWDQIEYNYAGKDYDKDVKRCFETRVKPKFTGQWYNYENHTFFNNGFKFSYEGDLSTFPVWFITVRATQGINEKAIRFPISARKMSAGAGNYMWLSDAAFNGLDNPDTVVVEFEFPRSSYTYKATLNLRK